MAKGIYVGVDSKARKVKKAYVGVDSEAIVQGDVFPKTWTQVVAGTSYIAENGTKLIASSASINGSYGLASGACDGNSVSSYWESARGKIAWIKLCFPEGEKINKCKIKMKNSSTSYSMSAIVQGSNDDTSWTELYKTTAQLTTLTEVPLNNVDYYKYYRLLFNSSISEDAFSVHEWEVSEYFIKKPNTAQKVKKGYIGVGGVARPFFSAEQKLEYYGTATAISTARYDLAATSVGDYALFGGGRTAGSTYSKVVDAYTKTLVKETSTSLSVARCILVATSIGGYALFGGGNASSKSKVVDTYTSSLVKGTATDLSVARHMLAATSVGDYALFGGGNASSESKVVDTYTSSLVKGTATNLSLGRWYLAATSVGDYALFGGGGNTSTNTYRATIDTYTKTLTKGTATDLSTARIRLAATSVGDYALFGGGDAGTSTPYSIVDTYTKTLVKGTATALSVARYNLAATSVGDYAIFAGGDAGDISAAVDVYTKELVKETTTNLCDARQNLAATSVGDYALFGSGRNINGNRTAVDVYQVV